VRPLTVGAPPRTIQAAPPIWWPQGAITLPGRALAEVGLAAPLLAPEQAAVFLVDAES
jgi:alpha-galactosidase